MLTKGTEEDDKELNQQRLDCFTKQGVHGWTDGMLLLSSTPPPLDKFEVCCWCWQIRSEMARPTWKDN